jgi:hypothetical protein
MSTVPPKRTKPKATTRTRGEQIAHKIRMAQTPPTDGGSSIFAEKMGRCWKCGARWIDDFTCPVHGRVA